MAVDSKEPKKKLISGKVSVIYVHKDLEQGGEYAHAFGANVYDIDADLFYKHAVLREKSNPDILEIFGNNLLKIARNILNV